MFCRAWHPHFQSLREAAQRSVGPETSSFPAGVGSDGGVGGVGTPRSFAAGFAALLAAAGSYVVVVAVVVVVAQWFVVVGPCAVESSASDHPWPPRDKTERIAGESPALQSPQY